jgi:hypothetical protein
MVLSITLNALASLEALGVFMEEKQRIAYHEAGHAVAMIQYGRGFRIATICRTSEYKGCVDALEMLSDHRKVIIVRLAGYTADVKASPETELLARAGAQTEDFPEAEFELQWIRMNLTDKSNPEESDSEYWKLQAREFVDAHWKAITSVANELLSRKILSSQEVESLVRIADGKENA